MRSPSKKRILLLPRNSSISALIICMILSASSFDEKRDTTKQELLDVLNISPLSWPASMLRGRRTFSTKAINILNCMSDVDVTSAIRTYILSTHMTVAIDILSKQLSNSIVTKDAVLVENCCVSTIRANRTFVQAIRHSYARNFACQQEHILLLSILTDINIGKVCSCVTDKDLYTPTLSMTYNSLTNCHNASIFHRLPAPYTCQQGCLGSMSLGYYKDICGV